MNIRSYKASVSGLLVFVFILSVGVPVHSGAVTSATPLSAYKLIEGEVTTPTMFYDNTGVAFFSTQTNRPQQLSFTKSSNLVQFNALLELAVPSISGSIESIFWPPQGDSFIVEHYNNENVFSVFLPTQNQYFDLPTTVEAVGWLPSGQDILFLEKTNDTTATLYQASMTNTNRLAITTLNTSSSYPSFSSSPNGNFVLVQYYNATTQKLVTQVINVSTKTKQDITIGDYWLLPLWSPDSSSFAYTNYNESNNEVLLDTRVYNVLTNSDVRVSSDKISIPLVWGPTSKQLFILSANDPEIKGDAYISKINPANGQKVTTDIRAEYAGEPIVPLPGTIVNASENLMFFQSEDKALYVMPLDGSHVTLTSPVESLQSPPIGLQYPTQVILPENVREGQVLKFYDPKTKIQQPTIYLVKLDGLHPFDSAESYHAYLDSSQETLKLLPGSVLQYTRVDSVPASEYQLGMLGYDNGDLVNFGGTIFLIMNGEAIPFANKQAFEGLGYSYKNVSVGTAKSYMRTNGIFTAEVPHPWGSWVKDGNTVYYVDETGLIGVPGMDIFYANNGKDQFILPANKYDRATRERNTLLPVLTYADPRLPEFDTRSQAEKNAERVSSVRQIASALELYFNDHNAYPYSLGELKSMYLTTIPTAPWSDGVVCGGGINQYSYTQYKGGYEYQLLFCLTEDTGGLTKGMHVLSQAGIN